MTESGPATSNATTNYFYDDQGKLNEEAGPYADIKYGYDNVGNRLTRTVSGSTTALLPNGATTNAYDLNDRIATVNGVATHTYDADGNETTVNGQAASYDFENHLVSLGSVASYAYDADGNRYSASNLGATTSYVVDTSLPYASVVEEYNGTTLAARYDYGDDLVRMDRGSGVYYYIYDGLGSTRQLVNTTGAVTDSYGYSAFGEMASRTGSTVNPFLFNAQQFDQASGDYYLRARYYDQSNGRFVSQDPFEGNNEDPISLHRYLYANNDPINMTDPGGEDPNFSLCGLSVSLGINTSLTAMVFTIANRVYSVATTLADAVNLYYDWEATGAVDTEDVENLALDIVLPKLGPKLFKGLFGKFLCFTAGTPVVMADGHTKTIEKIRIGDLVLSRDETTGKTEAKKVIRLFRHQVTQTLVLHFRGGTTIETTPSHPFYVQGRGFIPAGQLAIGTSIVTRAGPSTVLERFERHSKTAIVYNFEVQDFHTYFVGKNGLWVHNKCDWLVSPISGDWLTKGAHIKIKDFELFVKVNEMGEVYFEKAFASGNAQAEAKAVKAASELLAKDPRFLAKLLSDVNRAIPHLEKLPDNIAQAELNNNLLRRLRDALTVLAGQ